VFALDPPSANFITMSTNPLPLNPVVAELVAEVTRLRNQVRVVFRSSVFCLYDTFGFSRSKPAK
jgi:hypothetical protein